MSEIRGKFLFNLNIITDPNVLAQTGMTQQQFNDVIDGVQLAADVWGRYIDSPGANIDLELDFSDLPGNTLAEAGPYFFSYGGPYNSEVLFELNGNATPFDIDAAMSIDLPDILSGDFFYSTDAGYSVFPGNPGQIDFLSLITHELGHVFGFNGFQFAPFLTGNSFTGANAIAANGGRAVVLADGVHIQGNDLMSPSISNNTREYISPLHIAILTDLGVPIVAATGTADVLYGFELFGDTIHGLGGNDQIFGLTGNDTLSGGSGDDQLFGGGGYDTLNGGAGAGDVAHFSGNESGYTVTINAGTVTVTDTYLSDGNDGTDTLTDIEFLQFANILVNAPSSTVPSLGNDIISGTSGNDTINALAGNDTVDGLAGHDNLFGGLGNDTLIGGDGNDMLYGGLGVDDLKGGAGFDYARYNDVNYGGFTVSLHNSALNTGAALGDTFSGIEGLILGNGNDTGTGDNSDNYLYGMNGNDRLIGRDGTDHLIGGNGNDTLEGGADGDVLNGDAGKDSLFGGDGDDQLNGGDGADKLYGGAGADAIDGGDGFDYIRFDDANHGNVIASLSNQAVNTGVAAGDSYSNIEGLVMGAGNDRAYGDAGDNYLFGMSGNDMLYGGAGVDYIHGGAGLDYARYDDQDYGNLYVSLLNPALNTGAAAGDQFIQIEGLITGAGNDIGYGNSAANYMYGMGGNDVLVGQSGNDRLNGGSGNDRLVGGSGDDRLTGGADNDTFVFRVNYDNDEVWDFSGATAGGGDRVDLKGVFANFTDVENAATQIGSDIKIAVNANDTLLILNYQKSDLVDGDFIL